MEPAERKKRVAIAVVGAVIALVMMGSFFAPIFRDFWHARQNGQNHSNTPLFVFGGFFLFMALMVVFSIWRGIRNISRKDPAAAPREPQPWLKRDDWAAGRIKSTAAVPVTIMIVFALAFGCFGGAMAFFVLPQELQKGNYPALFILLFPAVGLGFLIALVRRLQARRKFGDCCFELAQIPAPLGGTLEGQIFVGTRLRPEHGLHLKLSCVRRIVGRGSDDHTSESILWQDEKVFRPEADLPEPEPGRTGIPVFFKLPADQPECFAHGNEAIIWRLEAKAKMSAPNFSAMFEVPVFRVAGAVVAETEADAADPTAALQESVEQLRREEGSKIVITDGPNGREFYFPAARNPGAAAFITAFGLVWSGFLWLMIVKKAPLLFPIVFGLFDVFIVFGVITAWFKSSRVTIDSTGVRAVNRWLPFGRTRRFDAADIAEIITQPGMQSGSKVYWAIKLVTRAVDDSLAVRKANFQQTGQLSALKLQISEGRRGTTIAGDVASKPEADWLAREMTKALGRKP
jgi:hypothetical protein